MLLAERGGEHAAATAGKHGRRGRHEDALGQRVHWCWEPSCSPSCVCQTHTFIHLYIRMYTHTYICTYIFTHTNAYIVHYFQQRTFRASLAACFPRRLNVVPHKSSKASKRERKNEFVEIKARLRREVLMTSAARRPDTENNETVNS